MLSGVENEVLFHQRKAALCQQVFVAEGCHGTRLARHSRNQTECLPQKKIHKSGSGIAPHGTIGALPFPVLPILLRQTYFTSSSATEAGVAV